MDALLTQLTNKLMAEQQACQTEQALHTLPPPPYTGPTNDNDEADSDDEDSDPEEPLRLIINAQHHIQGSHNLVPTSPTPLADATKFSTLLLGALSQLHNANNATLATAAGQPLRRRNLKLDVTINCGITVIGDRNMIGNVGVKPKPAATAVPVQAAISTTVAATAAGAAPLSPAESTVAGAKRRRDEQVSSINSLDPMVVLY